MYFPCVVYYSSWQKVMKFGKMPINECSFNPRVSPGTIFEGTQVSLGGWMLFCPKAIVSILSLCRSGVVIVCDPLQEKRYFHTNI